MKSLIDEILLDYGRTGLRLRLDHSIADWHVIGPKEEPPPVSFGDAFIRSVSHPIGTPDLRQLIQADDEVIIVTSDGTRPVPNRLLIPAIIEYCRLHPSKTTILVGTGSHTPHTTEELENILGSEIMAQCSVVCHNGCDDNSLHVIGVTPSGITTAINSRYIGARKKIIIGFIEPHLFAGFSGGPKGICPAICGLDTIEAFHSYEIIGHPESDYGKLENNPQQQMAREVAALAPPDFMINVILNSSKEITHIFSGHYIEAHRAGCIKAADTAMVPVDRKYPIVVATNSGYPLDQNLYQTVKGMAAAALIVEEGGTIYMASECIRGLPAAGNFAEIMSSRATPDSLLHMLSDKNFKVTDRWQAQRLAMILKKADVRIFASLAEEDVERCKLKKVDNLQAAIAIKVKQLSSRPSIAVMPHGPLTIPYTK